MTTSKTNRTDTFEQQLSKFKKLLIGAKLAKLSSIVLITISLALAFKSRDNNLSVMLLLMGALAIIFFIDKFMSLKDIRQKSYTQMSLLASITKLKTYMSRRKKYEMYFIAFWMLTLMPFSATYFSSNVYGILGVVLYIAVVGFLGNLAYKKSDKEILELEMTMSKELENFI
ncbi:hypothetical protein [Olleya sp. Bg11-27]|uniref:hypothetical protein n=1 Tax=Olleya sp. Bg11-27 TaxID=2058135 RepID=UPI000C304154|nr:hypothetical protein [Olleya sp. Bg11-27]AUC75508.1 hypothetical protein CW732_07380 [Olleya sp. Bg11-27]